MFYCVRSTLRPLVCSLLLIQIGAALAAPLAPALAETIEDADPIRPNPLNDLASDAVAVTDESEIKKKLTELTIYGRYHDGEDWIEYHLADGRTAYFEKGCTYPGKWWVEQGEVCYAYPNYLDGAPNCFVMLIRPDGSIQFAAFSGNEPYLASSSTKTAPGNDAHLPLNGVSPCLSV